ncbi:TonB-dependent receptor [Novosphingobium flavum]|uniref:TonB-dependent receptor n=1 Tax=Novosphingobium flavum TaxID=1778672 RepID=A0A7X1FTI0_9SPHN|nr:TonB-dependent receptor [Novosphingobium flavum]MBC2666709.1 TonB-dependent receptor [Novosphingobium flavum]
MNTYRIGISALALAWVLPTVAQAQEQAPAEAGTKSAGLEEIVVTAEKRTVNVQKTAIAIDVMTSEKLAKNGVTDISALQAMDAGVQIAQSASATFVTVRGVSGRDATEIGDPAVAINVDGVFLQRPNGMNAAFFDLDRIEVLRGPQGTLYGRNATGGVVNIISKRPNFDLGGYAAVTVGNYKTVNGEGAINVPLGDSLAMRASFTSRNHDGYRNNTLPGSANEERGDDEKTKGARLQLLFKPDNHFSALLSGTYIDQGGNGPVGVGYMTSRPQAPTSPSEAETFPLSEPGVYGLVRKNLVTELNYDFGPVKATYLFGFAGLDLDHKYDIDGTAGQYGTQAYVFRRGEYSKDYSHEFRLASNGNGPFTWQVGAFFYKQNLKIRSFNTVIYNGQTITLRNFNYDVEVKSKAGFGQVSYALTDDLKVSAGVRFSEDTKQRTGFTLNGPSLTATWTTQPTLNRVDEGPGSKSKDTDTSWHLGIDYQISPSSLIYAKADKGYKSGGFTTINAYGPETVKAYEIGAKNRFLGNTLQVNLSAFIYDYTGQQVSQLTPNGTQVLNAGRSRVRGVEAQIDWRATPNDTIDLSVNYLNARFREFAVASGGVNVNLAGYRLVQAPDWAISGGYEHSFDLPNGATLAPRAQFLYRSEQYLTFFNRLNDRMRPYATVDLSATYTSPDKKWSLQAYVRNLTNQVVVTSANIGSFTGTNLYQFAAPRTFGGRLQVNF